MRYEAIKKRLEKLSIQDSSKIEILQAISNSVNLGDPEWEGRDLVIRALDKFKVFEIGRASCRERVL